MKFLKQLKKWALKVFNFIKSKGFVNLGLAGGALACFILTDVYLIHLLGAGLAGSFVTYNLPVIKNLFTKPTEEVESES